MEVNTMNYSNEIEKNNVDEIRNRVIQHEQNIEELVKSRVGVSDPAELVAIDKKIAEQRRILSALNKTLELATYKPAPLSDEDEMLKCLNKYFEKKQEKEKDIRQLYEKNRSNILKTEQELKNAMQGGELDRVVELTNELDDLKSQTGYIEKMKREIELSRTFPYGAIKKEWDDICNRNMDDWISIIRRIEILANEYKNACNELLSMKDTLTSVRNKLRKVANENGEVFNPDPIFTVGLNPELLTISKYDGLKAGFIMNGEIGQRPL